MIYCDTSLLVSALTPEARSREVQLWLQAQPEKTIAISQWVHTEFASAIAIKGRIGDLDERERAQVLAVWAALKASFHVEPVQPHHFENAASLLAARGIRLRAGDAMHLAIAQSAQCEIATLDHDLATAAAHFGVPVAHISAPP